MRFNSEHFTSTLHQLKHGAPEFLIMTVDFREIDQTQLAWFYYLLCNNSTSLHSLSFINCRFDDHELPLLCQAIVDNKTIRKLEFIECDFMSEKEFFHISQICANNQNINEFTFSNKNYYIPVQAYENFGSVIAKNTTIKRLNLNNHYSIEHMNLAKILCENQTLEELSLNNNDIHSVSRIAEGIAQNPGSRLRKLSLRGTFIRCITKLVNVINQHQSIRGFVLDVGDILIYSHNFSDHLPYKNIKALKIEYSDYCIDSIEQIAKSLESSESLEELSIQIPNNLHGLTPLARLQNDNKKIKINIGTHIHDQNTFWTKKRDIKHSDFLLCCNFIANNPFIHSVSTCHRNIIPPEFHVSQPLDYFSGITEACAKNPNIHDLIMNECSLQSAVNNIVTMIKNNQLAELDFKNCQLDYSDIFAALSSPTQNSLAAFGLQIEQDDLNNNLSHSEFELLANMVGFNTSMNELYLSGIELSEHAVSQLKAGFQNNTRLTHLEFYSVNGSTELLPVLIAKPNLSLTLAFDHLSDRLLLDFKDLNQSNIAITELSLESIDFNLPPEQEVSPLSALINLFQHNATLTSLKLTNMTIRRAEALAIAELLKNNESITELDLESSSLTDETFSIIVSALSENHTLLTLNLGNEFNFNDYIHNSHKTLQDALRKNYTLVSLGRSMMSYSRQLDLNRDLLALMINAPFVTTELIQEVSKQFNNKVSKLSPEHKYTIECLVPPLTELTFFAVTKYIMEMKIEFNHVNGLPIELSNPINHLLLPSILASTFQNQNRLQLQFFKEQLDADDDEGNTKERRTEQSTKLTPERTMIRITPRLS